MGDTVDNDAARLASIRVLDSSVNAHDDLVEALHNTVALLKAFVTREDDIARATLEQAEAALAKASPANVASGKDTGGDDR